MKKAILCFIRRDDEVLLIHDNYPTGTVWNGISGYIEENETPLEAAIREVREEVGISIQTSDLQYLGVHDSFTIFEVWSWQGTPQKLEEGIIDIQWFKITELPYDHMHAGNQDWLPRFLH